MRSRLVLGAALLLANASPTLAQGCVEWGEPVELSGIPVTGVYPGPPDYESVAQGDERYSALMLHLRMPICINAGENAEMEPDIGEIVLIQLACTKKDRGAISEGEVNSVTGTLFPAHTGYHVTQAVLRCS